ncbi:unnamed protein product [Anisakis simplex]|uniref:Uncharacterized protein n=1 Tax=Anisakis simplex TaxID=6269 RepID=A0A0M3J0Q2_ANISI|nr:unnamed protein product [Anisakis simplex]
MASSDPQKNISKPGNDSEEEEEDYVPAPRPHRYVYKYHRVGSRKLNSQLRSFCWYQSLLPLQSAQYEVSDTLTVRSISA